MITIRTNITTKHYDYDARRLYIDIHIATDSEYIG